MKNYTEPEIASLINRFEQQQLPKAEWTHEAHLVVAIWYNFHYDFDTTLVLVRKLITAHNTSVGTPNTDTEGYHETITKFWLHAAGQFLADHSFNTIADTCNSFINSNLSGSDYPLNFYSKEVLFSVNARHNWIEPDLKLLQ